MLYPLLAYLSLYAFLTVARVTILQTVNKLVRIRAVTVEELAVIMIAVALLIFGYTEGAFSNHLASIKKYSRPLRSSEIVDVLKREIAVGPGQPFRGSVATILGSSGGTFRPLLGLAPNQIMREGQIEDFRQVAAKSGSTYDLLDLWDWHIPTLSEYGQGVSRQLMFYVSHFLSSPKDPKELDFEIPRKINIDILRAMGVRFLVTDSNMTNGVIPRVTLTLRQGAVLHLYELPDPNVGNYSPTKLRQFPTIKQFVKEVESNNDVFQTVAFVDAPNDIGLTPAQNLTMIFERGGIHVTAKSDGASAILLPVQFSHCYQVVAPPDETVTVERANIIHTLVLFNRKLDVRLHWRFRFPAGSECRIQDVKDLKAMGVV